MNKKIILTIAFLAVLALFIHVAITPEWRVTLLRLDPQPGTSQLCGIAVSRFHRIFLVNVGLDNGWLLIQSGVYRDGGFDRVPFAEWHKGNNRCLP